VSDDLLCTVEEAKLQINKSTLVDDDELLDFCRAVTLPIENMCGEILPQTITDERHTVYGDTLVLNAERVVSITSVTAYSGTQGTSYTQVATPATGTSYTYLLDPASAILTLTNGCFNGQVFVTYVAGMAAVPANVNLAARIIVANLWETQQGGAGLPDVYGDGPQPTSSPWDVPIPPRAQMLLAPYRRSPRVG
jgi:hypothetical protein